MSAPKYQSVKESSFFGSTFIQGYIPKIVVVTDGNMKYVSNKNNEKYLNCNFLLNKYFW